MVVKSKQTVNKGKLAREIGVIVGIILIVFVVRFVPWLMEQPVPWYAPFDKYKALLWEVERYDYDRGSNPKLESRLGIATESVGDSPVQYHFNQAAKGYYYYHLSSYKMSLAALEEAIRFAPQTQEERFVYDLFVKNYKALGQEDKVREYEELRDAKTE